jgi:hypothetical protein
VNFDFAVAQRPRKVRIGNVSGYSNKNPKIPIFLITLRLCREHFVFLADLIGILPEH